MAVYREDELRGQWIHAHEEDTNTEMVFRPASHPLPPSRGRMRLELRPGGAFVENSPGPVDVPEEASGSWSLRGHQLTLSTDDERPNRAWELVEAQPDRLVLRKPT